MRHRSTRVLVWILVARPAHSVQPMHAASIALPRPYRPETPPCISPGAHNIAKISRNVKSRFLTSERQVVAKVVEDVSRGLSRGAPSYPVMGLHRVMTNVVYSMPTVSANMNARCRHMDCPSGHVCVLVSSSVERTDDLYPLAVKYLSHTMSDRSYATLTRTTSTGDAPARLLTRSRTTTPPTYFFLVRGSGDYQDQGIVPLTRLNDR